MAKKFVVMYGNAYKGKCYDDQCGSLEEAEESLKAAIESMDGDNWCGLHIEEIEE